MEYLKIFTDFARSMEPLDDAERGRLFSAMLAYAERGQVPDLPGNERFIWPTAQLHIDREIEFCEKQRQRGIHGGRPKTRKNPEKPEETQKEKDKDNDKDKDNPSSPDGEDVSRPRGPYANVYLTDRELETFRAEYHGRISGQHGQDLQKLSGDSAPLGTAGRGGQAPRSPTDGAETPGRVAAAVHQDVAPQAKEEPS